MCQRRSRREQSNEGGLLIRLQVSFLLLFCSRGGFLDLQGCQARWLLPNLDQAIHDTYGYGFTGDEWGGGGRQSESSHRSILSKITPNHTPLSAPSPAPSPKRNTAEAPGPMGNTPAMAPGSTHTPTMIAGGEPTSQAPLPYNTNISQAPSNSSNNLLLLAVTISPAVVIGLLTVTIAAIVIRRRRLVGRGGGSISWRKGISDGELELLRKTSFGGVPSANFEELEAACEEFTNVIGASTDYTVFKGTRESDGLQIVVTKMKIPLSSWTPSKEIGFRLKVEDLARMNHDNLVNLLAYCASEQPFERMLVFEYASNGTLYEHLHGMRATSDHLDWMTRMRIIMGAAYGLQYMHHELDPATSHFRFDASHVFLTEDYAAKVADFGISTTPVGVEKRGSLGRRASFQAIAKTMGYNDWEAYRQTPCLEANRESNMRSFGVFLLEVISGRPPFTDRKGPLVDWAADYLTDSNKMANLVDHTLKSYKRSELVAVCEVVRMCIQTPSKGSKMATMKEVVDILAEALKMTREMANSRGSPLMWAEMQLLANSMDKSADDLVITISPRHRRHMGSYGSSRNSSRGSIDMPWGEMSPLSPANKVPFGGSTSSPTPSPRPNLSVPLSTRASNANSNRPWADNASELELLSLQEVRSDEEPDAPLTASHHSNSTSMDQVPLAHHESFGKSFRRTWTESASELLKVDLHSPRRKSPRSDTSR